MQKKANIYAPLEGSNEGWIVEIIDENHVNTGFHYMAWSADDTLSALVAFSKEQDFFPAEYAVSLYYDDRDKPFLRGKVCDGEILGWRYA